VNSEQKSIIRSFYFPVFFVAILWAVKIYEVTTGNRLTEWGVYPRAIDGLRGILTMPFIHSGFDHLISNSIPLLILGSVLIYFYNEVWVRVFVLVFLLHSIWLWLGGRPSYHIGASGIVYGLASFLFLSGLLRRHIRLMAVSMLVVFLYGGMFWGIFPFFLGVSYEAHLAGSVAGLLCAWVFRKEGLQRPVYEWNDEEEDTLDWKEIEVEGEVVSGEPTADAAPAVKNDQSIAGMPVVIHYDFKKAAEEKKENEKD